MTSVKRPYLLLCLCLWLLWWVQVRPKQAELQSLKVKVAERRQEDQAMLWINQQWFKEKKTYPWLVSWRQDQRVKRSDRPTARGVRILGVKQTILSEKSQQIEWIFLAHYAQVIPFLSKIWQGPWGVYLQKISLSKMEKGLVQLKVSFKTYGEK